MRYIISQRSLGRQPLTPLSICVALLCCRHFSSTATTATVSALKTVVITGSTRTEGPPRPILGPRVARYICSSLESRGHVVSAVLDPSSLLLLEKPHFAYSKRQVPPKLQEMADALEAADCYVAITPEYNHAPSPGLINILNHFVSSLFSFKPSAIVSYSAGQWGGTRAAHALRPILSELGCLPVSAMIHVPQAQDVFDEQGNFIVVGDEQQQWDAYTDRCLSQLEWWGEAARQHKQRVDPFQVSPAFTKSPTQRNAP